MADNFDTSVNQGGTPYFNTKAGDPQLDSKHIALQRFSFRLSNARVYFGTKAPGQYNSFAAGITDQFFGNTVIASV